MIPPFEWDKELEISFAEIIRFVVKRPAKNTAPGPDSVKATIWKKVPPIILQHLAKFTVCMREGIFPTAWKRATLVLIPKGLSQDPTNEIKARPICLLDEIGKILERIIADRINYGWMRIQNSIFLRINSAFGGINPQ